MWQMPQKLARIYKTNICGEGEENLETQHRAVLNNAPEKASLKEK